MSSPLAPPAKPARLGPTFAVINDVDRRIEEQPAPSSSIAGEEAGKNADDEIDELLSNDEDELADEEDGGVGQASGSRSLRHLGPKPVQGWVCRWDDCWRDLGNQDDLVEHIHADHIGQHRQSYICLWELCPRKGQKQATRHSLITHCRAHTGERPYSCEQPDCGKTFTRSDALTKHLRSLHGITPDFPPTKTKKPPKAGAGFLPDEAMHVESGPGSSPIVSKRSEIDDVIADALLSPVNSAPAPLSNPEPLPAAVSAGHVPKAAARPRKSSSKKAQKAGPAAPAPAQAAPIASSSSSSSTIRNPPLPLPDDSAFMHPDIEQFAPDVDLGNVLRRLVRRTQFWYESDDDEPALDTIREKRARYRQSPPPPPHDEDYDSLDEEIPDFGPPRVVAQTTLPEDPTTKVAVMSHSKWQARYMMSKAKVMLLSEENEMRRKELERTLQEEMDLDDKLG